MRKLPLKHQVFPTDYIAELEASMSRRSPISGDLLANACEQSINAKIPERVRNYFALFNCVGEEKRGRPLTFGAALDFTLLDIEEEYPALLAHYQQKALDARKAARMSRSVPPKGKDSPRQLAYAELLKKHRSVLGNMDWLSLANLHSKWKSGNFHPSDIDNAPLEFDEKLEQHFPHLDRS